MTMMIMIHRLLAAVNVEVIGQTVQQAVLCMMTDKKGEINVKNQKDKNSKTSNITSSQMAVSSATDSAAKAKIEYSKPEKYTGNRHLYDSPSAKRNARAKAFADSETISDPYTGKTLFEKRLTARAYSNEDWASHTAEVDHKYSISNIFNDNKSDPFLKNEDIKSVANCEENLVVTSRRFNNAKRQTRNEEFVNNKERLDKAGIELSEEGKAAASKDGLEAETIVNNKFKQAKINNIKATFNQAGLEGAKYSALSMLMISGPINIVSVIRKEKSAKDAIDSVLLSTLKSAISGYCFSGALTVISQSVSNINHEWIKKALSPDMLGTGVTVTVATAEEVLAYINGEKSLPEVFIDLGEKGTVMFAGKYCAKFGASIIPNKLIGSALGGALGSIAASLIYKSAVNFIKEICIKQVPELNDNSQPVINNN